MPTDAVTVRRWAERSAAWVDGHLERFSPWESPGVATPRSLQRFAELAIAVDVVGRSPLGLSAPSERWAPFVRAAVAEPVFAELARSRLDLAWAVLLPYLVLRARGERDAYHDATLAAARTAGYPEALEVVPYRALDYAYFAARAGLGTATEDEWDALARRTSAARASCRASMTEDSAYALTHAVFYVSAFGQQPVAPGVFEHAAALVDSMVVDSVVRGHLDLLGELLIAATVLPGTRRPLRDLGLRSFFGAMDTTGAVPPDAAAHPTDFDSCYHTTMVALLLCASLTAATS